jgi:cytochrome c-type biogenesis protein CcsB
MQISTALLIAALVPLLGSGALGVGAAASRRTAPLTTAYWALVVAAAMLLGALLVRAGVSGRPPWTNLHETAITFAGALALVFLALERRLPIRRLSPLVALITAALVWLALAQPDEVLPLVPALQSPLLLTVHVGSAMLAYAIGGVAFAAAAAEIVQRRAADRVAALPSAAVARATAHRAILLGFPVLTAAIVLGAVWANLAWRSYWSNDPKELAAAATWLVYGGYLHIATRRDRWGDLAPWLIVAGFAGVLFTYLGAGLLFVGEHSYAGS